jgi:trehalose 6-phosphate synthase
MTVTVEDGRRISARSYPASVDVDALRVDMASPTVASARARLADQLGPLSIIRVDRLDPGKNQLLGFLAFERLLEMRPDLRPLARFSAFLVPSRTDLSVYRAYHDELYGCIESINSGFGADCGGPPITVFYTNDRDQALAAMERCDVLLVNSLQDGMNLVAKEWAVVSKRPGVLVLSETTGAAEEAAGSALFVSPLDVEGTARAMAQALDMPEAERTARLSRFRERVYRWTAQDWLEAQLRDLHYKKEAGRTA